MPQNHRPIQQDLAQQRTGWAYERTQMAAVRTYFALLRTGLAIAGGGAIIAGVLARSWPSWVVWLLTSSFVVVGFGITVIGLQNYRNIMRQLPREDGPSTISVQLLVALTVVLQLATAAVMILFLLG